MRATPDIIVDVRGESCPVPVARTSAALRKLPAGGTVLVIADDPAIAIDLPAWCYSNGHHEERLSLDGDEYRYLVRKSDGRAKNPRPGV